MKFFLVLSALVSSALATGGGYGSDGANFQLGAGRLGTGRTGGSTLTVGGSRGGSTLTVGGSSGGSTLTLGGSRGGSTLTLGGSRGGSTSFGGSGLSIGTGSSSGGGLSLGGGGISLGGSGGGISLGGGGGGSQQVDLSNIPLSPEITSAQIDLGSLQVQSSGQGQVQVGQLGEAFGHQQETGEITESGGGEQTGQAQTQEGQVQVGQPVNRLVAYAIVREHERVIPIVQRKVQIRPVFETRIRTVPTVTRSYRKQPIRVVTRHTLINPQEITAGQAFQVGQGSFQTSGGGGSGLQLFSGGSGGQTGGSTLTLGGSSGGSTLSLGGTSGGSTLSLGGSSGGSTLSLGGGRSILGGSGVNLASQGTQTSFARSGGSGYSF